MKQIPLTQGKFALVDDADFDWLNQWKWFAHKRKRIWYAARNARHPNGDRYTLSMHSLLLPEAALVDHWDGNGLNNQRHNVRAATQVQNSANAQKRANESGFKGVDFHKDKRWRARLNGKFLGYFSSSEAAARAYDVAAKELFGEFARLNFP